MKRLILKFVAAAVAGAVVSACGGSDDHDNAPAGTIVQVAEAGGLSYLLAAATKAELADELSAASTAGLTVFAPTNAAFNTLATQLGLADGPALVAALPKEALASILSYHVLPAKKSAADLTSGGATQDTIYSFDGAVTKLNLTIANGVVIKDAVLTDAKVTTANIAATNGVVHILDKVLVPPGVLNMVQMARPTRLRFHRSSVRS